MGACSACENGGTCQVEGSSKVSCLCPPSYTGLYCEVSLEPSCPDDICTAVYTSSFTIFRADEGDIINLASDSNYCSSIRGYCVNPVSGRDLCGGCKCEFRLTYREDTEMCEDYYSGNWLHCFSDNCVCTFRYLFCNPRFVDTCMSGFLLQCVPTASLGLAWVQTLVYPHCTLYKPMIVWSCSLQPLMHNYMWYRGPLNLIFLLVAVWSLWRCSHNKAGWISPARGSHCLQCQEGHLLRCVYQWAIHMYSLAD